MTFAHFRNLALSVWLAVSPLPAVAGGLTELHPNYYESKNQEAPASPSNGLSSSDLPSNTTSLNNTATLAEPDMRLDAEPQYKLITKMQPDRVAGIEMPPIRSQFGRRIAESEMPPIQYEAPRSAEAAALQIQEIERLQKFYQAEASKETAQMALERLRLETEHRELRERLGLETHAAGGLREHEKLLRQSRRAGRGRFAAILTLLEMFGL